MDVRLAMTGFGNVGRGVAQLLADHRDVYEARYGVKLLLTAVADRGGAVIDADGLDERSLLQSKRKLGSVAPDVSKADVTADAFLLNSQAHVLIEAASTNFEDAEPGWTLIQTALAHDMDVVMASKGALVLHFAELMGLARSRGKSVSYSATIGAPLPVLELINRALIGTTIMGFEGVLNSTANVILQAMMDGKSYDDGVREAQALGVAETDPTLDVDGWDAAAKAAIVANTALGSSLSITEVSRQSIRSITPDEIRAAVHEGSKLKLISAAYRQNGSVVAEARVERRGPSDALGRLRGSEMGIVIHTEPLGDFTATVEDSGGIGGGIPTALTVLRDVFNLAVARGWNGAN